MTDAYYEMFDCIQANLALIAAQRCCCASDRGRWLERSGWAQPNRSSPTPPGPSQAISRRVQFVVLN